MKNTHSNFKQNFLFCFIDSYPAVLLSVCNCKCYNFLGSVLLLWNLPSSVMNFQPVLIYTYKFYFAWNNLLHHPKCANIYIVLIYYLTYHNAEKLSVTSTDVKWHAHLLLNECSVASGFDWFKYLTHYWVYTGCLCIMCSKACQRVPILF